MIVQESIDTVRRTVYGGMAEQVNLLANDYVSEATVVELRFDTSGITPGMILSSGLNVWIVTEVQNATKTVYVVPRWDGSRAAPILKDSPVYVRPRVTDWHLFNEMNRAITSLSSRVNGLYQIKKETSHTSIGNWGHYPLASGDAESIIGVRVKEPWGGNGWHTLEDRHWRWQKDNNEIRVLTNTASWANEIEVLYRAGFEQATSLFDDLNLRCGLPETAQDIPALIASANLLLTTEGRRGQVTAQGDPRRASEVTPGQNSSAAREMRRLADERINEEHIRLVNAHGYKVTR